MTATLSSLTRSKNGANGVAKGSGGGGGGQPNFNGGDGADGLVIVMY